MVEGGSCVSILVINGASEIASGLIVGVKRRVESDILGNKVADGSGSMNPFVGSSLDERQAYTDSMATNIIIGNKNL